MQAQNQISSHQNNTPCNAEIVNFRHSQIVDYQHSIPCKNLSPFTGKEKDSETGFYYFGARYYDCDLSGLFLSVDPMADKYPNISPYHYCHWNPISFVDNNGCDDDWYQDQNGNIVWDENVTSPDNTPKDCLYLGKKGKKIDEESGKLILYTEKGETIESSIELPPVIIYPDDDCSGGKNESLSRSILKAGTIIAISVSQTDSPLPGPGDLVAIGIETSTVLVASIVWLVGRIIQPFAHTTTKNGSYNGHKRNKHEKQYTHGGKNRNKNPNQRKGAEERKNKGKTIN